MKRKMNKVYVSPVCHLVEVAAQMSVICTSEQEVLVPTPDHGPTGPAVAPKRI